MNAWLVVLAAGLGSYLFRLSVVTLADRIALPDSLERATELIAPASFAAIAASIPTHGFCVKTVTAAAVNAPASINPSSAMLMTPARSEYNPPSAARTSGVAVRIVEKRSAMVNSSLMDLSVVRGQLSVVFCLLSVMQRRL